MQKRDDGTRKNTESGHEAASCPINFTLDFWRRMETDVEEVRLWNASDMGDFVVDDGAVSRESGLSGENSHSTLTSSPSGTAFLQTPLSSTNRGGVTGNTNLSDQPLKPSGDTGEEMRQHQELSSPKKLSLEAFQVPGDLRDAREERLRDRVTLSNSVASLVYNIAGDVSHLALTQGL
ncbi:hypothetical protein VTK73DRAFT_4731 [Phialemonium thermophilum]|uniref:Uncharacterized protein n=1 Tax=Phialemonium thermophilum TaxID=223376 RepID=A0ABR3WSM4_9PEZI